MSITQGNRGLVLGVAAVIGGLTLLTPTVVNADTTPAATDQTKPAPATTRTATVKLPATAYYAVNGGKTYAMTGSTADVTLKANHNLKNYTTTTWTATAQTDVTTPNGQTVRYLYVKNARNGATGWVAQSRLKAGRHYQSDAPKKLKAKNYVRVKTFKKAKAPTAKVYQFSGKRAVMHWTKGKALSKTKTYKVTQKRTYYQNGKPYSYYHVTSGKTKGWVWRKDLKAGTYYSVAKHQAKIKAKLKKYLKSVTKDKTAEVAFYNLSPVKGSAAAKAKHAAVYKSGKLAVNARGNHVTTSASTYKLYIAAYLMHLKQQHRFSWTKANRAGMTRMIVNSANDYPVSILQKYGRTNINHWLASQGYYGDPFSATRNSMTTANSLIKVLKDLQNGKKAFTNKKDRAFILGLMGRQVYRKGIPTGVTRANPGTTVQDKVGFLYDNNGDAGIVTMPNGQRYLLAVLTWGHGQHAFTGFPRIAKIAENVQKIVY
ncbi:hypothetical protein D1831_07410 [Lactiplantibacillus garii]|uniref:Beta-lactamase class A catalytic domain-containing protein n=1 Tax=Lactiplantibacillus garii TaxID=2306423 RepID=A0A3R8QR62_9LACO|nr:serine hydrolase [Lactiplantibacillus garii]RRK10481.1 hypothetical protein D1831_07410 [Lactiplantibacillus garii]